MHQKTELKPIAEIKDPIHGYIFLNEVERSIIDTYVFQRLRYIKQLSGAYITYPGADHTRFSHSLGVMHVSGVFASHLYEEGFLKEEEIEEVRLAGLLHDIGHGPFSHTFEELTAKYLGKTHEDLSVWLILNSEIKEKISSYGYDPKKIALIATGKYSENPFLTHIISGAVDSDKMDFLLRDSHYTGVEYGLVDIYRLIYSSSVVGNMIAFKMPGALFALESFLIARYEMFKAVYFHRTVRSAEIMISRAMEYARDYIGLLNFNNVEDYIVLDDYYVLTKLRELKRGKNLTKELKKAAELVDMLDKRILLKCSWDGALTIYHIKDKFMASILTRDDVRHAIEEEIACIARVDPETVIIDVPTVPSIPYSISMETMEIPVYTLVNGHEKTMNFSDISNIASTLKGFMDVVRVYTFPKFRKRVAEATRKFFGETSNVSYRVSL